MYSDSPEVRNLVAEISKRVVADIAPNEMPLFNEYVDLYEQNRAQPDVERDTQLGLGLGDLAALYTPAAMAMVNVVVSFIMEQAIKALKDESADLMRAKIKDIFNRLQRKSEPPGGLRFEFSEAELQEARELAVKQAKLYKIGSAEAERMADELLRPLMVKK